MKSARIPVDQSDLNAVLRGFFNGTATEKQTGAAERLLEEIERFHQGEREQYQAYLADKRKVSNVA
jgi:hypothetical protein